MIADGGTPSKTIVPCISVGKEKIRQQDCVAFINAVMVPTDYQGTRSRRSLHIPVGAFWGIDMGKPVTEHRVDDKSKQRAAKPLSQRRCSSPVFSFHLLRIARHRRLYATLLHATTRLLSSRVNDKLSGALSPAATPAVEPAVSAALAASSEDEDTALSSLPRPYLPVPPLTLSIPPPAV